jgi:methyl-accepting chemotaxis protein
MRAAEAARNTAALIEGTLKKVETGSSIVGTTNETFQRVLKSTVKAGLLVEEIAAASREQTSGIEQVNTAIAEMDTVVQQNAASAEESASAAEEMNAQAEHLRDYVGELLLMVTGKADRTILDHGLPPSGRAGASPGRKRISAGAERKQLPRPGRR